MPTRSPDVPPLTNVLSISTAGRNRYLFHFSSHHSLVQWTAAIRLCMFEHSKLQEIYTGALIAAKGKSLNAIGQITARTTFKYGEWVRVRFGAGTPWRKCWAVISPPDEKAVKKAKAAASKKAKASSSSSSSSPSTTFPHAPPPLLKGDIKFFDSKKNKKMAPIATIVDAFAAYALYPQDKRLIEMSTLVKIEGRIRVNGDVPTENEGYVFVMPDVHPAVSGFETMLRFLFPTYDSFSLYGRPAILNPDKRDVQSLMFAMPADPAAQQSGYLDVVDVVNVVVNHGADIKLESQWREQLKALTKERLEMLSNRKGRPRSSLPTMTSPGPPPFGTADDLPSSSLLPLQSRPAPGAAGRASDTSSPTHARAASEATGSMNYRGQQPAFSPYLDPSAGPAGGHTRQQSASLSETSSDDGLFQIDPAARRLQQQTTQPPPEPVPVTPRITHPPSSRPQYQLPVVESPQENLFAGVVPLRSEREYGDFRPDAADQHHHHQQQVLQPQYAGHPPPTQITQQRSLGYDNQLEAPPGFALQSSRILLRGPPPTHDQKVAYDDEYADRPPPGRPESQDYGAPTPPAPEYTEHGRSWQPTPPPSGSPSPPRDPAPQPAAAAAPAPRLPLHSIERKPVMPAAAAAAAATQHSTPDNASLTDLSYLIDQDALNRIGPQRHDSQDSVVRADEDSLDLRAIANMQKVLAGGDSESEYGDESEDEPDYASSVDTNAPPPPKRDATMPRVGVMKVVGQKPEPDVVIGDVRYRPGSSAKAPPEKVDIPKVDFGTTVSHGRSLSTDLNLKAVPPQPGSGGPPTGGDNLGAQRARATSGSSGVSADWNHPSPGSQGSGSDLSKRRSVAWQPGIVPTQPQGSTPDRSSAERFVAEKAAAAATASQSRNRYAQHRKSSANATPRNQSAENLPTRPSSRGGNAAFLPHGLVSSPNLSANLSAREQEFVAQRTGSTLLQMDQSQRKAPPHKAGLVGAIESRETEKRHMRESRHRGQASLTVQQEIARRQQQQQQKEQAANLKAGRTPSPRGTVQQFEQQQQQQQQQQHHGYLPQLPHLNQYQQQQQQQQFFAQQQQQLQQLQQQQVPFGYGHVNQGNRTPEGYHYNGRN